jgi:hypothetical protein
MGSEEPTSSPDQSLLDESQSAVLSLQRLKSVVRPLVTPLRPRIVFTLLLTASGLGRWLTAQHRGSEFRVMTFEWLLLLSTGVLVGFVGWRLILWEGNEPGDDAVVSFVSSRFESTVRMATGLLALGAVVTVLPLSNVSEVEIIRVTAALLAFVAVLFAERNQSKFLYTVSVAFGLLVLGATTTTHVSDPVSVDVLVRLAHLTAFAIWFGGATWHNVVLVPGIRQFPEAKSALKSQAERFRPLVIGFIVVLLLTGLYQTVTFIGLSFRTFLGTTLGIVVCVKLLVLSILSFFPFLR